MGPPGIESLGQEFEGFSVGVVGSLKERGDYLAIVEFPVLMNRRDFPVRGVRGPGAAGEESPGLRMVAVSEPRLSSGSVGRVRGSCLLRFPGCPVVVEEVVRVI